MLEWSGGRSKSPKKINSKEMYRSLVIDLKVASENVVNYHVFQIQMAKCHRRPAIVLFRLIR